MESQYQVLASDLNILIRNAQSAHIQHLDGLMRELFGRKAVAIKVFWRLLRWMPYSKRADGAVYKSARELAQETASSEVSVARAKPLLEAVGFDVFLKKANGAPTNHYKLNVGRFLERLAQVFGATVAQIRAWMWGEQADSADQDDRDETTQDDRMESGQSDRMETTQDDRVDSVKVGETVTPTDDTADHHLETQKQTRTTDVAVSTDDEADHNEDEEIGAIGERIGAKPSTVTAWVNKYGRERVLEVVEKGEALREAGKIRKSLVGWIRAALRDGYTWGEPESAADSFDDLDEQIKRVMAKAAKEGLKYVQGRYAAYIEH